MTSSKPNVIKPGSPDAGVARCEQGKVATSAQRNAQSPTRFRQRNCRPTSRKLRGHLDSLLWLQAARSDGFRQQLVRSALAQSTHQSKHGKHRNQSDLSFFTFVLLVNCRIVLDMYRHCDPRFHAHTICRMRTGKVTGIEEYWTIL